MPESKIKYEDFTTTRDMLDRARQSYGVVYNSDGPEITLIDDDVTIRLCFRRSGAFDVMVKA